MQLDIGDFAAVERGDVDVTYGRALQAQVREDVILERVVPRDLIPVEPLARRARAQGRGARARARARRRDDARAQARARRAVG